MKGIGDGGDGGASFGHPAERFAGGGGGDGDYSNHGVSASLDLRPAPSYCLPVYVCILLAVDLEEYTLRLMLFIGSGGGGAHCSGSQYSSFGAGVVSELPARITLGGGAASGKCN